MMQETMGLNAVQDCTVEYPVLQRHNRFDACDPFFLKRCEANRAAALRRQR